MEAVCYRVGVGMVFVFERRLCVSGRGVCYRLCGWRLCVLQGRRVSILTCPGSQASNITIVAKQLVCAVKKRHSFYTRHAAGHVEWIQCGKQSVDEYDLWC